LVEKVERGYANRYTVWYDPSMGYIYGIRCGKYLKIGCRPTSRGVIEF